MSAIFLAGIHFFADTTPYNKLLCGSRVEDKWQ